MNKVQAVLWGILYTLIFIFIGFLWTVGSTIGATFPWLDWGYVKEYYLFKWKEVLDDGEPLKQHVVDLWNSRYEDK